MKKNISQFAVMALFFSSLAFAGEKPKSTPASDNAQPAAAASSDNAAGNNNPCVSTSDKKAKKSDKNKAKPAPTDQEEQFNKVLMGIYG